MTAEKRQRGRPAKLPKVVKFIEDYLPDGREVTSKQLTEAVLSHFDISERSIRTARKQAGVVCRKSKFQGPFWCFIPEDEPLGEAGEW